MLTFVPICSWWRDIPVFWIHLRTGFNDSWQNPEVMQLVSPPICNIVEQTRPTYQQMKKTNLFDAWVTAKHTKCLNLHFWLHIWKVHEIPVILCGNQGLKIVNWPNEMYLSRQQFECSRNFTFLRVWNRLLWNIGQSLPVQWYECYCIQARWSEGISPQHQELGLPLDQHPLLGYYPHATAAWIEGASKWWRE